MVMQIDIRELRKSRSWTQTELAEYVGVDQATVSRWEQGKGGMTGSARKSLERLAEEIRSTKKKGARRD